MFFCTGGLQLGTTSVTAPPRRYEVLAQIIECIARDGVPPTYDEIGAALEISATRVRQLVDQLLADGDLTRTAGSQRNLRVRNSAASRERLLEVLRRLGFTPSAPMGQLQPPCVQAQLPLVAVLSHVPDADAGNDDGRITAAR